jgi:hypothetical protein
MKYCLKTGKQGHPNELSARMHGFFAQLVFAQQPTPIVRDPKLTPGDACDITAQDVCVTG